MNITELIAECEKPVEEGTLLGGFQDVSRSRGLSLATDSDSEVGSCDCLTKSPDIQHHKKGCKYRLIVERDEARSEAFRLQDDARDLNT